MKYRVKRHEVVQPLDESYRLIPLTRGQNAIVDTADFDWLNGFNWRSAWSPEISGFYAATKIDRKHIAMHVLILDCKSGEQGDHWNHDTLDNRRNNLRKCTCAQNRRNSRKAANKSSKYKGVSWNRSDKRWQVFIWIGSKNRNLGSYASEEEAARAYDEAAKKYYGEFAHLNFL